MQLSSVEKAGGRQVPRHREAGRRKHGTTMTRRTPRKGRLRPSKLQLIQSAAVSTCCQFWFTERAPVQWPHLPPKIGCDALGPAWTQWMLAPRHLHQRTILRRPRTAVLSKEPNWRKCAVAPPLLSEYGLQGNGGSLASAHSSRNCVRKD